MKSEILLAVAGATLLGACEKQETVRPQRAEMPMAAEKRDDMPPLDPNNIASLATKSADHTTLVAALKAADYMIGVANAGPLTVFAPVNAAFAALPPGTVENLLKPENVDTLRHVLQHHVVPSSYQASALKDGQVLGMVDGTNATVHVEGDKVLIDEATIVASVRASNGMLHIIDKVLLPPKK